MVGGLLQRLLTRSGVLPETVLILRMVVPALIKKFEPHLREFYVREYGAERNASAVRPAVVQERHCLFGMQVVILLAVVSALSSARPFV